jgi:hypothetical protein
VQRINYAAGSVVTGDRLAHAVVAYASALARNNASDLVSFPVLLDSGEIVHAEVLIGPASQVLVVPERSDHEEILDDDLAAELDTKTHALSTPRPGFESFPDRGRDYPEDY